MLASSKAPFQKSFWVPTFWPSCWLLFIVMRDFKTLLIVTLVSAALSWCELLSHMRHSPLLVSVCRGWRFDCDRCIGRAMVSVVQLISSRCGLAACRGSSWCSFLVAARPSAAACNGVHLPSQVSARGSGTFDKLKHHTLRVTNIHKLTRKRIIGSGSRS